MSLIRSLWERRSDTTLASAPASWLLASLGGGKTAAGQVVTPATAEGIPVIHACVGILAETVGQLPLKLYREVPEGRRPATDHPLYGVLHDLPNPYMTAIEFREVMMRWLCLWGNAYAEIERRADGQVVGLWPLASDRMTLDTTGRLLRYRYSLQTGGMIDWVVRDANNPPIMHLKINSQDGFLGRSPITQLRESLGITVAADRHAASFFGNGAVPDLILSKKGPGAMSPKAKQNFVESWKEKFGGSAKAHGIALLEEEFTGIPLTMPMKDAQFLEVRAFQIEDGARIYRIPLFMLGHTTAVTSWGTGIESMGQGFVNFTLMPWLVRWEQAIARDCLSIKTFKSHFARFETKALMRGDSQVRAGFYTSMVATGAMSPNDIRECEEMNGIGEDGDKRFISANLNPLDAPTEPPAPPEPAEPLAPEDDGPAPETEPEAALPPVADEPAAEGE